MSRSSHVKVYRPKTARRAKTEPGLVTIYRKLNLMDEIHLALAIDHIISILKNPLIIHVMR